MVFPDLRDRLVGEPGTFDYVRCNACGTLQIAEVPADLGRYYQSYSPHVNRSAVFEMLRRALLRGCYTFPRPSGDRTLLDIGCGSGWYMEAMMARGWKAQGYEPDADTAQRAANATGVRVVSSLEDLPDASFDLVTMNHVVEHVPDPAALLTTVLRLLRPGGRAWLSVPDPEGREARRFGAGWFHLDPPRHLSLLSRSRTTQLLEAAGFRGVSIRSLPAPTGFAGSWSYRLTGRLHPVVWYAATLPGLLWMMAVPDGFYGATAHRPAGA
ncbi:MAG TPA: class I SAM-dependent methyltransferase [Candidatus Dormibacteraeota bacterium]|nr:class I SAM-dependent methyltransferase [Candidatus Dormibacteraeota bacterium]